MPLCETRRHAVRRLRERGDSGLQIGAIATRGSRQNLALLERGEIELGLVEGNAAHQALDGIGRPPLALSVLSVMYPNPGMFVVRADAPYQTIEDLRGRPVAFGTRASGLRILADDVLSGLGLSATGDFEQLILEKAAEGPRLVLERKAEALWGAGIGWPGFVKLAEAPGGARFIAPSAEQVARILDRHPHLREMSLPAGTYRGQDERTDSVGLWSLILVRPDPPDSTAYRRPSIADNRPLPNASHKVAIPRRKTPRARYPPSVSTRARPATTGSADCSGSSGSAAGMRSPADRSRRIRAAPASALQ